MSLEQLAELFKWMSLINIGIFFLSVMVIMSMKNLMSKLHGRFFGVTEEKVSELLYVWLGNYKICMLVLNIVPFVALTIIT